MTVRVDGLGDLNGKLRRIEAAVGRAAKREVKRTALNVQRKAREAAPMDTGRLRNSIAVEDLEGRLDAAIGTNVEYGPFIEFGTRHQHAQPYLFPAMESERVPFRDRFNEAVIQALREATG